MNFELNLRVREALRAREVRGPLAGALLFRPLNAIGAGRIGCVLVRRFVFVAVALLFGDGGRLGPVGALPFRVGVL